MKIKSKYFVFIFIVCILFTITAVSANDNQTDSLNQGIISDGEISIGDNDELMQSTNKSYNDFYDDIKDCNGTFDIKKDYVYDESDNNTRLAINQKNLVINGNNHIIDGSNRAKGFVFMRSNTNVTINDLTFINCNQSLVLSSGNVTLNNVNFTGNFNSQIMEGIITFEDGNNLIIDNCNFNSNINTSLIFMHYGDVAIYNSHFYNTHAAECASIFVNRKILVIENCTFENLSSIYGGAINFRGDYLSVKNSAFKDVNAYLTGGVIIAKYFPILAGMDTHNNPIYRPSENWLIENNEFLNVSSTHNGGVLYINLVSENPTLPKKTLYITKSNFTDSSSGFGGAIGHQDGALDISNTNFINSRASDIGGAIYTTWANLTMKNCNVINSSVESNAGAIYFDNGKIVIERSNFTDNKVNAKFSGNESVIYARRLCRYQKFNLQQWWCGSLCKFCRPFQYSGHQFH